MMKKVKQKLTLDRPATYQIKVPGHLNESWSEWTGGMTITVASDADGLPFHHPNRYRRPGCLAGLAAPALLRGLAADFGKLCRGQVIWDILSL